LRQAPLLDITRRMMRGQRALGRFLLAVVLLTSVASGSSAQRYGRTGYGGHWHGGYYGGHYGYRGYGYRPYYGHYRPYYAGYYCYAPWGFLGVMLGAVLVPRPVYYYPVVPPPPPPIAQYQQCPDGSTVPVGTHCVIPRRRRLLPQPPCRSCHNLRPNVADQPR